MLIGGIVHQRAVAFMDPQHNVAALRREQLEPAIRPSGRAALETGASH